MKGEVFAYVGLPQNLKDLEDWRREKALHMLGTEGAKIYVLRNGSWKTGRLLGKDNTTQEGEPPWWRTQFDDENKIRCVKLCEKNPGSYPFRQSPSVRFDRSAYMSEVSTVEVRYYNDGIETWYAGRLVELVKRSDTWGVAFEGGDWSEDVRVTDACFRHMTKKKVLTLCRSFRQGRRPIFKVGRKCNPHPQPETRLIMRGHSMLRLTLLRRRLG